MRVGVPLAVLLLIVVVTLQIIFWTNVPRNLVINAVQQALGLRVTAATLSTGFFGHTTLRDVTLALPLADESFFKVEQLTVDHTSVPGLIFKRTVAVQSVEMLRPRIVVRQDAGGNWNLQDVATLIARAGGSGNPQQEDGGGPSNTLRLPKIAIVDGSVLVAANNGQQAEVAPLNVRGEPEGSLTWKYDVSIGKQLMAVGRLAPGGTFKHEVELKLRDVGEWVSLVSPGFKHAIHADGTWNGQIVDGELSGQLQLTDAAFDKMAAKGAIGLTAGKTIKARPNGLTIRTGSAVLPEVTVLDGVVRRDANAIVVDSINTAISGGTASLSARYEPDTRKLQAGAVWEDIGIVGAAIQSGSFNLALSEPLAGRPEIQAKLQNAGRAGEANWDVSLDVRGDGRSFNDIDWTITADRLAGNVGRRKADLTGSVAHITTTGQTITLHSLERRDASALSASGQYDLATDKWSLWMNGQGPRLPGGDQEPMTFMVNAWSDGSFISLDELYLRDTELEITGKGYYMTDRPDPVFLNLSLSQVHTDRAVTSAAGERPLVGGHVLGDFYIHGKMNPSDLYLQGWLTGKDLVIADRSLGDVKIALDGSIDKDRHLSLKTQELSLLDGRWSIDAFSPTPWDSTRINLKVRDLPLQKVGELMGRDDVGGTLKGSWTIDATGVKPNDVFLRGDFSAVDLAAGPLRAETLAGTTRLRSGRLRSELTFKQADGDANFALAMALAQPTQLTLTTDVNNWPATTSSRGRLVTSIDSKLQIDTKTKSATGDVSIATKAFIDDQPAGDATLDVNMDGRLIQLRKLEANLLGGVVRGGGTINLDRPLQSNMHADWSGFTGEALGSVVPGLSDLRGTFDGFASIRPDVGPRPLGTLTAIVHLSPTDAHFRSIDIGGAQARLAIDVKPTWRVILDTARFDVAGGSVDIWGRAAQHVTRDPILVRQGRGSIVAAQTTVRLRNLDLNTLVQAAKPGERPLQAKLTGEINLIADSTSLNSVVGNGRLSLDEGKLVNFRPVEQLFKQMNVSDNSPGKGYGTVALRMERGRVDVNDVHYYEAGIEMLGLATVYDLYERKESQINGTLVGTIRPFRDTKLSILADADEIFSILQSQLSAVDIYGNLGDIKVRQALVGDIGDSVKQMITGSARSESKR